MAQLKPVTPRPETLQRGRTPYPAAAEDNIKGNAYLRVADRIAWMRRDYPCAEVSTHIHSVSATGAVITATIRLVNNNGFDEGSGSGIGTCKAEDFGDFVEKAETAAIGRALGTLGYGTADQIERGVVDTPRPRPQQMPPQNGGRR